MYGINVLFIVYILHNIKLLLKVSKLNSSINLHQNSVSEDTRLTRPKHAFLTPVRIDLSILPVYRSFTAHKIIREVISNIIGDSTC